VVTTYTTGFKIALHLAHFVYLCDLYDSWNNSYYSVLTVTSWSYWWSCAATFAVKYELKSLNVIQTKF